MKNSGKIKVAILADMPRDVAGGKGLGRGGGHAATWLSQLTTSFSVMDDLEIVWITLDKSLHKLMESRTANQRFLRVPSIKMTLDILTGHRFARKRLLGILAQIKPDLVHLWGSEGSYPSVLKGLHIPSIMSMQGILSEYDRIGSFHDNWRMRWQAAYEKQWVKQATLLTSESKWGISKILEIHPEADCRQVEYGVHPSFYDVKWTPDPLKPIILYVGGLEWRKGTDLLVEAMSILPVPQWKCLVAGAGTETYEKQLKSVPQVELLGNLNWKDLQSQLRSVWALVLPTRADTSPNVVKEARVVGLPVISTLYGGQNGYIRHGENGFLLNQLKAVELRKYMDMMMQSLENVKTMGNAHHEENRDYFMSENTASSFRAIYHEIVSIP